VRSEWCGMSLMPVFIYLARPFPFLGKAALTVVVGSARTQPNISAVLLGPDLVRLRSLFHHLESWLLISFAP